DNNFYPVSAGHLIPVSSLGIHLMPAYIRVLPAIDGWNQPYRYYSNGAYYWILWTSADRTPEEPTSRGSWRISGTFRRRLPPPFDRDTVCANGQFIRY